MAEDFAIPDVAALWETLPATKKHTLNLTVQERDLDDLHHVNNTVYLTWCEQVARQHALRLGMGTEALTELGAVPVARQHIIRYEKPALLGDAVRVRTALTSSRGARSTRTYTIDRLNPGDPPAGVRLCECRTDWVWVDPATGHPKRTPGEVMARFGFVDERLTAGAEPLD